MARKPTNPTPKKAVTRNREWKPVFLRALSRMGNVSRACKSALIDRDTAYAARKADGDFRKAWRLALEDAADVMEREAWRRAVKGTAKPVYQQGACVGTVQEYSDTLLIFLLKGIRPGKFRDTARVEHTGKRGGAIQTEHKETTRVEFDHGAFAGELERFITETGQRLARANGARQPVHPGHADN